MTPTQRQTKTTIAFTVNPLRICKRSSLDHRGFDVSPVSTYQISLIRGAYSPFTHTSLVRDFAGQFSDVPSEVPLILQATAPHASLHPLFRTRPGIEQPWRPALSHMRGWRFGKAIPGFAPASWLGHLLNRNSHAASTRETAGVERLWPPESGQRVRNPKGWVAPGDCFPNATRSLGIPVPRYHRRQDTINTPDHCSSPGVSATPKLSLEEFPVWQV